MNYTIDNAPLTWRQFWITGVASLGQLVGTALATLVSIIIPLYQINAHPELDSFMQGLIGAMDLIGIVFGSVVLGRLSDEYGYLKLFRICPLLICAASIAALIFPNIPVLIVSLFIMGFAIGGEYSLDSDYITVLTPSKWKFIMVGGAKAASSVGNIIMAGVCYLMIKDWTNADLWPQLLWTMIAISALMFITRINFWESPVWLANHGRMKEAEEATHKFLGDNIDVAIPKAPVPVQKISTWKFICQNWRNVIFTGIPWACEGLGVYGIGVFLPILVLALGIEHSSPDATRLMHVNNSVAVTFLISCVMLPGFVLGLWLINKMKGAKIQWIGFFFSAISLTVLLYSYHYGLSKWISIAAFMAFELFLNMGPHLMTYVLPAKVYPVQVRGQGSGLAASIGKIGAVLGVFCIPVLLKVGGTVLVLSVSIAVMLLGGVVTILFAPKSQE